MKLITFFLKYLVRMAKKQTICLCRLMDECAMLDLEKSGVKPDITQSKHKCKLCGVYISGICLGIYYEGREIEEIYAEIALQTKNVSLNPFFLLLIMLHSYCIHQWQQAFLIHPWKILHQEM